MNSGYIYILQNPSLSESHLKIGRTERDPDGRAVEISRATGVPTPFEVVWWSESVDCHLAESILHHHLDRYRTNATREFFDLEIDEAIRVAKRAIRQSGGRTGGMVYFLRRVLLGTFHSIILPLLRLPVQLVLLFVLLAWWLTKGALFLGWRVIRGVFSVLIALFSSPGKGSKSRRRKAAEASGGRQKKGVAFQGNVFYLKEIVGVFLWIGLMYFFLYEDGTNRCREIFQSAKSSFVETGNRL